MNKTSNYQLCQWDGEDRILRTDFNEDNAKIDAALKQQANSIAGINAALPGKADAATVTSLTNTVNQKANQSALTAEVNARTAADNTEKAAREAADTAEATARAQGDAAAAAARAAALALKGNCQIYYGTYEGEGTMDKSPLTFPAKPILVLIQGNNQTCHGIQGSPHLVCANDSSGAQYCAATWSGNSLSWTGNRPGNANVSGITYYVVALMAADE